MNLGGTLGQLNLRITIESWGRFAVSSAGTLGQRLWGTRKAGGLMMVNDVDLYRWFILMVNIYDG